jgi:pimeloyl-ACP methyl ester carboxylesterase
MSPHWPKVLIGNVIFILIGVFLLTPAINLYLAVHPEKIDSSVTPKSSGLAHEDVWFMTSDDIRLSGWYVPKQGEPSEAAVIILHGYPASKGDLVARASFLAKDYNLLFFDFRYFGQSAGSMTTVGATETEDLLAAIRLLKVRGMKKIGVYGFSLGGAVALMTLPLTKEIDAVVSEGAYASLCLIAEQLYRPTAFLKKPLAWMTCQYARALISVDPFKVSPVDAVAGTATPILLIHAQDDDVVPFEHALLLQQALKDDAQAEFEFVPGSHGLAPADFGSKVSDFFGRFLKVE